MLVVLKIAFGAATLVSALLALDTAKAAPRRRRGLTISVATVLFICTAATAAYEGYLARTEQARREEELRQRAKEAATTLDAIARSVHPVQTLKFNIVVDLDPDGETFRTLKPRWDAEADRIRTAYASGNASFPRLTRTTSWATGEIGGIPRLHWISMQYGSPLFPTPGTIDELRIMEAMSFFWVGISDSLEHAHQAIAWFTRPSSILPWDDADTHPPQDAVSVALVLSGRHPSMNEEPDAPGFLVPDAARLAYSLDEGRAIVVSGNTKLSRLDASRGVLLASDLIGKFITVATEFAHDEVKQLRLTLEVHHGPSEAFGAVSHCTINFTTFVGDASRHSAGASAQIPAECVR